MSFDSYLLLGLSPVIAVLAALLAFRVRSARRKAVLSWAPALAARVPGSSGSPRCWPRWARRAHGTAVRRPSSRAGP
jgi:hypothetical protein